MVRSRQRRRERVEEDPMAGTSNLVDAMLVIAVGFLVFVIISWNMQAMIDPSENIQEQMQQKTLKLIRALSWMRRRIPATVQVRVIPRWVRFIRIRRRASSSWSKGSLY